MYNFTQKGIDLKEKKSLFRINRKIPLLKYKQTSVERVKEDKETK